VFDFAENGITAYDQMVDSPTNNFATLNAVGWQWSKRSGTMSEGNLKCFTSGSDWTHANGTIIIPKDKKIYFEIYGVDGKTYGGIALADENAGAYSAGGRPDGGWIKGLISGYADQDDSFPCFRTETDGTALATLTNSGSGFHNAVCGIAIDQANSNVKFYVNNSLVEDITSSACFNTTSDYVPIFAGYSGAQQVMNFGQDSSFAGNKTSGSAAASDGGGSGDFYYAPPSGFLALCTSNLPDVAVTASLVPSTPS
jgi:hypothetical protein